MVLQDEKGAWGKYYRTRKKTLKRTRYRKKETDLKVFYIYFPSPCTTKKPQNKNATESSWKPEVYCISENLTVYISKQKKNVCRYFLISGNILSRIFNIWEHSVQEPMEEQELMSYPNYCQLTARYYTALYLHVLLNCIEIKSFQARWSLEYISGMSYITLHLALNLLGISCIYAFCLNLLPCGSLVKNATCVIWLIIILAS